MNERLNWLILADKFASDGDPRAMRACARELFELDKSKADGPAIMAEAALYLGKLDEAETLARSAIDLEPDHLRGRLILGAVAAEKFDLKEEFKLFSGVIKDSKNAITISDRFLKNHLRKFAFNRQEKTQEDLQFQNETEIEISLMQNILFKALSWMSNGLYLAGEPDIAADYLFQASDLTEDNDRAAELYSKHLFLKNYRDLSPAYSKELAKKYQDFFDELIPYNHEKNQRVIDKKLKIGYVSPDFRQHAVANFILPFLREFDAEKFSVTCYQTGKTDAVTDRLKRHHISWRDLSGRSARTAARLIYEDHVDILVDLSGHSQNNCLPIMAYKPAPIQISAIGYTATTGLKAIDYFLSDTTCLPEKEQSSGFTEKILRLKHCHFCYSPGIVRDIPPAGLQAPMFKNDFVTYGSFNNFAKVTDETLYLWRAILEQVKESILVIKGKICSVPSGREILLDRLKKMSFPIDRVELRPYSPDYLEQYRDIDVALDTFPYNGGLTTCEALYMGVPVVTLRGRSHGARIGASILTNADVGELIAQNPMEYVKKAVQLARRKELIAGYHAGLRDHLLRSPLMDSRQYIKEIEIFYREIWKHYCKTSQRKRRIIRAEG
ncbi:MAG: hypothetical protein IJ728_10355 [Selenomonadaceae bacterium]|nr:hypothetical protein [Selenomonadaceae bacterium]